MTEQTKNIINNSKLTFSPISTLLELAKNSVGSSMFQSVIFKDENGNEIDVLERGNLSCTYFVSSLLVLIGYIQKPHVTVAGLLKTIEKSNKFLSIQNEYRAGDIIFWEETVESNGHPHVGFYIDENKAISNSTAKKVINIHHFTYGINGGDPNRKIVKAFRCL